MFTPLDVMSFYNHFLEMVTPEFIQCMIDEVASGTPLTVSEKTMLGLYTTALVQQHPPTRDQILMATQAINSGVID